MLTQSRGMFPWSCIFPHLQLCSYFIDLLDQTVFIALWMSLADQVLVEVVADSCMP